ncbi:MAG: site-specific integrase [Mycobacteriales bacterium]
MPLRPRCEYAADLPRSLPGSSCPPPWEFPATHDGYAPLPAQIHQVRAGAASRGCHTPVPRVLLSIPLAEPGPSGSTGPSRLCQGCSHPPRHHPDQAAPSSTPLLRQGRRRKVSHLHSNHCTSRRTHDLRHTAAYRMARDPLVPLTDVQWVLGHAQLSTTQIYLTPMPGDVIAGMLAHHRRGEQTRPAEHVDPGGEAAAAYRRETLDVLFAGRSR